MAKKAPRSRIRKHVLAFDLGGTKIAAGVVDDRGRVLREVRVPADVQKGKLAVLNQLAALGRELIAEFPGIERVGMASAGPLDPKLGVLLDPTNFMSDGKPWGVTPISRLLSKKLALPVLLENDAAAAILAEAWIGAAKHTKNAMIMTLGTGLGTAIVQDGKLIRASRGMHTEGGHIIVRFDDKTAPCGCGNLGCSEAYLSGRSFTRRNRYRFIGLNTDARGRKIENVQSLTGLHITELARRGNRAALAAFEEYAEILAVAIQNYVVIYAPEKVILTGSFAEASDLFLPAARRHLKVRLARRRAGVDLLPKVEVSPLDNQAGLIGGAWVALFRE